MLVLIFLDLSTLFLQPTSFFYINDLRGEVNPQFFIILEKKFTFMYFNKLVR